MALSPSAAAYLADLLTGIGTGMMAAPRGGPPLAGVSMGLQNANQLMMQRRQMADQDMERQYRADQIKRQQQADADAVAQKAAQTKALSQMLPTTATAGAVRNQATGAGPMAASAGSPGMVPGMSPEQISFLRSYGATDPGGALGMIGTQAFQAPKTPPMEEFPNANGTAYKGYRRPDGTIARLTQDYPRWDPSSGGQGESLKYGLAPVFATDKKTGKTVMILPNNQGGIKVVDPGENIDIAPQTQMVNTGTAQVPIDKRTGNQVPGAAVLPIDNSGKAAETTVGTATGTAQVNLPTVEQNADYIVKTIEALKNHPGREAATGATSILNPIAIPGTDRKDFLVLQDQIKGQTFLNAYDNLRGGGAITETEGRKAEAAKARLDTAQSEGEYLKALDEFEVAVKDLTEIARRKAAGNYQPLPSDAAPAATQPAAAPAIPEFTDPNDSTLKAMPKGSAFYAVGPGGTKTLRYVP